MIRYEVGKVVSFGRRRYGFVQQDCNMFCKGGDDPCPNHSKNLVLIRMKALRFVYVNSSGAVVFHADPDPVAPYMRRPMLNERVSMEIKIEDGKKVAVRWTYLTLVHSIWLLNQDDARPADAASGS